MCGIAGFLERPGRRDGEAMTAIATRMARALVHRGPDDGGVWVDPAAGIAFGHRRLQVVDLSAEGHQPMHSASGRYVLSFNGEIYNYRALMAELREHGQKFRGHSDTEVLLAGFEVWGFEETLQRSNGMFALALWDAGERTLLLARDRLGEKPLYYGRAGRSLVFGSELKGLREHPDLDARVDRDAVALFLRYNYVPAPHSILVGIRKLPAGSFLQIRAEDLPSMPAPCVYWSLRAVAEAGHRSPLAGTLDEHVDALATALTTAVGLRMQADVPLGAFLSGGIDSSTVVALMQAQSSRPIRTFSIGFGERDFNEAQYAKAVAAHLGTEHTEHYVTAEEALRVIPRLPELFDEPFADVSQIPTHLVAGLARRAVTVSLSGDGGDELFGGYTRYFWVPRLWRWLSWWPAPVRRLAAGCLGAVPPAAWERITTLCNPLLPATRRQQQVADKVAKFGQVLRQGNPLGLFEHLVTHWRRPTDLVPGAHEPSTPLNDPSQHAALGSYVDQMMYLDSVTYLPDDILCKVDRATMAVSLEARVPLLDHHVVELAWRLPMDRKIRDGSGKWILRQVLHRHVPPALIERPKMGFGVPLADWLRGPLREWADDLLAPDRLRAQGLLEPQPIIERWQAHRSGAAQWHYPLWDVLMLQSWLDATGTRVD